VTVPSLRLLVRHVVFVCVFVRLIVPLHRFQVRKDHRGPHGFVRPGAQAGSQNGSLYAASQLMAHQPAGMAHLGFSRVGSQFGADPMEVEVEMSNLAHIAPHVASYTGGLFDEFGAPHLTEDPLVEGHEMPAMPMMHATAFKPGSSGSNDTRTRHF
jgi:hypothetical protein